jgi:hypothetical protein
MGDKLAAIYRIVEEKSGNNGRVKLAMIAGISKREAEEMKDKSDVIDKLKTIATHILGHNIEDFLK